MLIQNLELYGYVQLAIWMLKNKKEQVKQQFKNGKNNI
jgi:hypothetical protein